MKIEQIYTGCLSHGAYYIESDGEAVGQQAFSAEAFEATANETNALILDTRDQLTFTKGFISNAINIGIDGNFAPWVGTLIPDIRQQILLVTDEGRELRARGFTNLIDVKGGFKALKESGTIPVTDKLISYNN